LIVDEQGRVTGSLRDLLEALTRTADRLTPEQRAKIRDEVLERNLLVMPVNTKVIQ
jgi:hypothetical protein